MKNILIASSVALSTVGINSALADVAITGDARMGVVYTESTANVDNQTQFDSRVRFTVAGTGTTDSGLTFGASTRIDQSGQGGTANNDSIVYIGNEASTLTFGDVNGATEAAVGNVAGVGYTGVGDNNEVGYLGVDNTAVSIEATVGPVGIYASVGQPQANSDNNTTGIGASVEVAGVALGVGYAEDGAVSQTAVGAGVELVGVGLNAVYVDNTDHATIDAEYAVSASYTFADVTVIGFYREVENLTGTNNSYTGVGAEYNLGGGATLAGGFVDQDGTDRMDLGLNFAF